MQLVDGLRAATQANRKADRRNCLAVRSKEAKRPVDRIANARGNRDQRAEGQRTWVMCGDLDPSLRPARRLDRLAL